MSPGDSRPFGHIWSVLLPVYFLAAATLDVYEVTNREYLQFVVAARHAPPEHWVGGYYTWGQEDEPVVLVTWYDAVSYCRWAGRRLPTVDEWMAPCEIGKLKTRGNVWQWTATDVDMEGQTFKALCGPGDLCDCSHRYLPEWKNEVKGFRCARDAALMSWLPLFFRQEIFS